MILLFIAFLITLLIGMIKPELFPPFLKGKKKIGLVLGSTTFIFLLLGFITNLQLDTQKKQANLNKSATPSYVFDVLSLVSKNIDEVRIVLGKPDKDIEPPSFQLNKKTMRWENTDLKKNIDLWQNTFKKEERKLVVTYNPTTRKVLNIFISKNNRDTKQSILKLYNLNEKDSRYKIEFIPALFNHSDFTDIKITPQ